MFFVFKMHLQLSAAPMAPAMECNSSSLIEYSDLCLRDDPPADCYPDVKVRELDTRMG